MVKQSVKDLGGVSHANVDDLGTERRVLVRDVGIEQLARFGPVLGIDMAKVDPSARMVVMRGVRSFAGLSKRR